MVDRLAGWFNQITGENHMKPEAWYDDAGLYALFARPFDARCIRLVGDDRAYLCC